MAMVSTGDHEPNDDLVMATPPPLGSAACRSDGVAAVVSGANDVDVFRTGYCAQTTNDPWVEQHTKDSNLRTCLFVACNFGTTNVYGCYQDKANDSDTEAQRDATTVQIAKTDSGFKGCCRTGSGRVAVQVECSGVRKHAIEGYLWLDSAGNAGDHPYSASYGLQ